MAKVSAKDMPNTIELLVTENNQQRRLLRTFLKWFDRNEREWSSEFRETTEFFDLQEIADKTRALLSEAAS